MKGYPKWFFSCLMTIFTILVLSGCLLIPTVFDLKLEWSTPWRLAEGMHVWVAGLHALLSFITLAIIGALWAVHMRLGWRRRKNHRSGLTLVSILLILLATAIGVYYTGDEYLTVVVSVLHVIFGVIAPVVIGYHIWSGRRQAKIAHQEAERHRH